MPTDIFCWICSSASNYIDQIIGCNFKKDPRQGCQPFSLHKSVCRTGCRCSELSSTIESICRNRSSAWQVSNFHREPSPNLPQHDASVEQVDFAADLIDPGAFCMSLLFSGHSKAVPNKNMTSQLQETLHNQVAFVASRVNKDLFSYPFMHLIACLEESSYFILITSCKSPIQWRRAFWPEYSRKQAVEFVSLLLKNIFMCCYVLADNCYDSQVSTIYQEPNRSAYQATSIVKKGHTFTEQAPVLLKRS